MKRSIGLAVWVAVSCSGLHAATPDLRPVAMVKPVREALVPVVFNDREIRAAQMNAPRAVAPRDERTDDASTAPPTDLWSLLAGCLAVTLFLASRRRID